MDGVVDAAFHVNIAIFLIHCVRHEDNVNIAAFLAKIGDGSNILASHVTFKEHQEMFIGNVRRTNLSSFFIGIGHTYQLPWNIF